MDTMPPANNETSTAIATENTSRLMQSGNCKNPKMLFIAPCVLEEEMDSRWGPACLLKGAPGVMLRRVALKSGFDLDKDAAYLPIVKSTLPRSQKLKPTAKELQIWLPLVWHQIKKLKPKVIVCLGKPVYSAFFKLNLKERELYGGWFTHPDLKNTQWIVTYPHHLLASKPEIEDAMIADLKEAWSVRNKPANMSGIARHYTLIQDNDTLSGWLEEMRKMNIKTFAVDVEFGSPLWCDYKNLRSVQWCWKPHHAVMLQFFDHTKTRFFSDSEFERCKQILFQFFNDEKIRYYGHNFTVEQIWLENCLKIPMKGRCEFDTMYALHTIDETAELTLKRLAMRYTDLSRYDLPLIVWKKQNKSKSEEEDGYGNVPTEILFPYACADVDATFQAVAPLTVALVQDETFDYFKEIKLPYVTDAFTHITETGIPLNKEDTQQVRLTYTLVKETHLHDLRMTICKEADEMLAGIYASCGLEKPDFEGLDIEKIKDDLKSQYQKYAKKILHWLDSRDWNPNSYAHKARWLYDAKEFAPTKSTKIDGCPPVAWEKVKALTPEEAKRYKPSVDKEVLQLYGQRDRTVQMLVEFQSVNQILKNFLNEDKKGLEKYIFPDGRVHTTLYLTETNRPKSSRPNILNVPKYVAKSTENAFKSIQKKFPTNKEYQEYLSSLTESQRKKLPTQLLPPVPLRWCFKAQNIDDEQWCFTEVDFCTAEVFALAYLAGDKELISALTEPDKQFVAELLYDESGNPVLNDEGSHAEKIHRVCWIPRNTACDEEAILESNCITPIEALKNLKKDEDGSIWHPLRDVHWEMVENKYFMNAPREKLVKKLHRDGGGKVGNFSIPYQASDQLLVRKVEVSTGVKQPDDLGQKLKEAYKATKAVSWQFLEALMELPENPGYYKSPTGAKRHFSTLPDMQGISKYAREKILGPIKRQASNVPMQGLVADTLARAVVMTINVFEERHMKARVMCPLYDAIYVYHPVSETKEVHGILQKTMSDDNGWDLAGGRLNFKLDFSLSLRWCCKPTKEERELLG